MFSPKFSQLSSKPEVVQETLPTKRSANAAHRAFAALADTGSTGNSIGLHPISFATDFMVSKPYLYAPFRSPRQYDAKIAQSVKTGNPLPSRSKCDAAQATARLMKLSGASLSARESASSAQSPKSKGALLEQLPRNLSDASAI